MQAVIRAELKSLPKGRQIFQQQGDVFFPVADADRAAFIQKVTAEPQQQKPPPQKQQQQQSPRKTK
jgi:hypothetical protein